MRASNVFFLPALIVAGVLVSLGAAPNQTPADIVHSFANQKLILLHLGDQLSGRLKKSQLQNPPGTCDIAVQIAQAEWQDGKVRFQFTMIGTPSMRGRLSGQCKQIRTPGELEITGFAHDEKPEAVQAAVAQILRTPEQYISDHGVVADLPPASGDEKPVKAGSGTTAPQLLLSVDPEFSEQARKAKYQGTVRVDFIVGTDGQIHQPRITRTLGMGLDEMALLVLPMWRFKPALRDEKAVAAQLSVEIDFHLY